jgi:hypothetical protein
MIVAELSNAAIVHKSHNRISHLAMLMHTHGRNFVVAPIVRWRNHFSNSATLHPTPELSVIVNHCRMNQYLCSAIGLGKGEDLPHAILSSPDSPFVGIAASGAL